VQRKGVAQGILTFLIGLSIFIDDLHDFVPGTEFLQWMPDFEPVIILGFQFHHLYVGILIMLIGLAIAMKRDE
jgi:hypothetical protein